MSLAASDPRHGTLNAYNNLACRCDRCIEGARQYRIATDNTGYCREWRHRTGRTKPWADHVAEVAAQHGTESKYGAGCRCQDCRTAASAAKRERRKRSRVPCVGCGTPVDSINRRDPDKPYECFGCSRRRAKRG